MLTHGPINVHSSGPRFFFPCLLAVVIIDFCCTFFWSFFSKIISRVIGECCRLVVDGQSFLGASGYSYSSGNRAWMPVNTGQTTVDSE